MNASQEFNLKLYHTLYQTMTDIIEEDYIKWMNLNNDEFVHEIMVRSKGKFNPMFVKEMVDKL